MTILGLALVGAVILPVLSFMVWAVIYAVGMALDSED